MALEVVHESVALGETRQSDGLPDKLVTEISEIEDLLPAYIHTYDVSATIAAVDFAIG